MIAEPKYSASEQMQLHMSISNPKWMYTAHRILYQLTGGRLGASMRGISALLLTTTGRKSGKRRTIPMMYLKDGDRYIICAANAGLDQPPAWWLNLQRQPEATIQVRSRRCRVTAQRAEGEERKILWQKMCQMNPFYIEFQKRTKRQLDLVILRELPQ